MHLVIIHLFYLGYNYNWNDTRVSYTEQWINREVHPPQEEKETPPREEKETPQEQKETLQEEEEKPDEAQEDRDGRAEGER
ncbi:hypothetical protein NDU88_007811 [Pleurodeles waltl]|uniref:Uncharacterized protein n=1 Tax=Pleurodeles waltl TaxID=8319 RepID=A0AAV7RVY1_PLEWA|nr:hypothetical protein NDU88_007811 [Pleurodeles waltl]